MNIDLIFESFKNIKVAVVGDVMLDTYWWGNVNRISPEAPVPIVTLKEKEYRIGGAGNVALNLVSLGAQVSMHTVTGTDEDGLLLEMMMNEKGINTTAVWKSADRMTTSKIRIMGRNQQMMRLDKEIITDLDVESEKKFITKTIDFLTEQKPQVVIFEDYNKGVLTEKVITELIKYCNANNIITTVDPKRKNFLAYKKVTIFKPNMQEVKDAFSLIEHKTDLPGLKNIHQELMNQLEHEISFITLSEKGVFYADDTHAEIIPAHVRNISDVSGAGDTVIAVASLIFAASNNTKLMAQVANIAGGLVCEKVGTAAIDYNELLAECKVLVN